MTKHNGQAHIQSNLAEGWATHVDDEFRPWLTRETDGTSLPLEPGIGRHPADDFHNTIAVGVAGGDVWVTGNLHSGELRLSRVPADLRSWPTETARLPHTNRATYPRFVPLPSGDLLLFWRDGVSGDGHLVKARLPTGTQTWQYEGRVLLGGTWSTPKENPYLNRITVDGRGWIHLLATWRTREPVGPDDQPGGADGNEDVCYTISFDEGRTWRDRTFGCVPSLTHATMETWRDTQRGQTYVLNNGGACMSPNGRTFYGVLKVDSEWVVFARNIGSGAFTDPPAFYPLPGGWSQCRPALTSIAGWLHLIGAQNGRLVAVRAYDGATIDLGPRIDGIEPAVDDSGRTFLNGDGTIIDIPL